MTHEFIKAADALLAAWDGKGVGSWRDSVMREVAKFLDIYEAQRPRLLQEAKAGEAVSPSHKEKE